MTLYIPHSFFHLVRLLYVRPETFGPYYVTSLMNYYKLFLHENYIIEQQICFSLYQPLLTLRQPPVVGMRFRSNTLICLQWVFWNTRLFSKAAEKLKDFSEWRSLGRKCCWCFIRMWRWNYSPAKAVLHSRWGPWINGRPATPRVENKVCYGCHRKMASIAKETLFCTAFYYVTIIIIINSSNVMRSENARGLSKLLKSSRRYHEKQLWGSQHAEKSRVFFNEISKLVEKIVMFSSNPRDK